MFYGMDVKELCHVGAIRELPVHRFAFYVYVKIGREFAG